MRDRLPPGLEVSALLRQISGAGGFATVIAKGHAEAGTILIILADSGANSRIYERMPTTHGTRDWSCTKREDPQNPLVFAEYLLRRREQDADLWIIELDIPQAERFIGLEPFAD